MTQLSLFPTRGLRDRMLRRNYSPAAEEFRVEHERHRAWGLTQRHARRLRQSRAGDDRDAALVGADQTGASETGASETGASETGASVAGAAEIGAAETNADRIVSVRAVPAQDCPAQASEVRCVKEESTTSAPEPDPDGQAEPGRAKAPGRVSAAERARATRIAALHVIGRWARRPATHPAIANSGHRVHSFRKCNRIERSPPSKWTQSRLCRQFHVDCVTPISWGLCRSDPRTRPMSSMLFCASPDSVMTGGLGRRLICRLGAPRPAWVGQLVWLGWTGLSGSGGPACLARVDRLVWLGGPACLARWSSSSGSGGPVRLARANQFR
jgi:hypothetical protein